MARQGKEQPRLGGKVRALRRQRGVSQARLAERLGISASYLNLIESNRRPLPADLLIRLAQLFEIDISSFAADDEAQLVAELSEMFADPLFDDSGLTMTDLQDLAAGCPAVARAVLNLYRSYQGAREGVDALVGRLSDGENRIEQAELPSEQVSDLLQRHMNHFPQLELGAEELWHRAKLQPEDLYSGLIRYLEKELGVTVRIVRHRTERGTLRRYDPARRILSLSELLPTRSRLFQLAHQIGLLTQKRALDDLSSEPRLSTPESRALARVALANYFAGAVLMPYEPFLEAAREERYDIDVLGRRFRVGFEQVCHRLTTLRRPGAEGVPFHMLRIDVAGNISKRFSASGIRFARFSGVCPRWNVFAAFSTPGMIRIQLSRMPDGHTYFCIARTIQQDSGGFHFQKPVQAIGLGCRLEYARELVYSDGVDLENPAAATPVGVTCRLCERTDCAERALPSLRHPLHVDENVREISLYYRRAQL